MNNMDKARVRAIGGVFFRSPDPEKTREWYSRHLGLQVDAYGTNFAWRDHDAPEHIGHTQWSPMPESTDYLGDRGQQFMVNYRVDDLDGLLDALRQSGVEIVGEIQEEPYGRFVHVIDNDGRRVELWEPNDEEYRKIVDGVTR